MYLYISAQTRDPHHSTPDNNRRQHNPNAEQNPKICVGENKLFCLAALARDVSSPDVTAGSASVVSAPFPYPILCT